MSLELVNTLATLGTFLVIAATAIAALIQLRHARSSNQIEALAEFREGTQDPEMWLAERFVLHDLSEKLKDPDFRYQLINQGAMTVETQAMWSDVRRVANFFENMGALVKNGLADKSMVLDIFSTLVLSLWERLTPVVAIRRLARGDNAIWENLEYLAVLSQDWEARYPNGTYPPGTRRLELQYPWLEADKQYAASLAPA
jgi:hypothetical protein